MVKVKRILSLLIAAQCVLGAAVLCACGGEGGENEETKYDVAIRVGCSDGNVYEFPVGEDEKHITIPYDGEERTYYVDSYNLPDHPRWSDDWFSPSGEGANVFSSTLGKVNQMYDEESPKYVCEIGEYYYSVQADSSSDLWNFRTIYL